MITFSKFYFRPGKGEQISTTVTPETDGRSAICGRVLDADGRPVQDALVLLFNTVKGENPQLEARFCTDEDGHFIFGPLQSELLYIIKIYKNNIKLRELEVIAD